MFAHGGRVEQGALGRAGRGRVAVGTLRGLTRPPSTSGLRDILTGEEPLCKHTALPLKVFV